MNVPPKMCPHKSNPAACPTCFRNAPPPRTTKQRDEDMVAQAPAPRGGKGPPPESNDPGQLWEPPVHKQLIRTLPRRQG